MNYEIIIDEFAIQEAQDAYDYYENKQEGLGEKFKVELSNSIDSISENPKYNRRIKNNIRQCLLNKFPFVVIFEIMEEKDIVIVYSIFHTSRNPKHKLDK